MEDKKEIWKAIEANTASIQALTEGGNHTALEMLTLRVLVTALLFELSENPASRDSLAKQIAGSLEMFTTHSLNSKMSDSLVEKLVPHTLSQIPRTIQPLVKQLLRLP